MSSNTLLMHKDTPVLIMNIDEGIYEVLEPQYLPYQLRGHLVPIPSFDTISTKYEMQQRAIAERKDYLALIRYAASRVLPITRDNAKKIYSLFGFEQLQDDVSKAKIAFLCRAVSLQDDYWFKVENDTIQWQDVNIRHNSLNEIVAQVALKGSSLTLQGEAHTPELNGQGAYAKAWKREPDGLYLHKAGAKLDGVTRDYECQLEITVSNILDKCNVEHLKYEASNLYGVSTCKCKCLTDDSLSLLPGMDFISYCNTNGMNPNVEMMRIDAENIYKMWIVDYLISNSDRHGMNWGFYYNSDSMEILKCHPLFDHNNAFDLELMNNRDAPYIFNNSMTMREAAHKAMQEIDFHFTSDITQSDFMNTAQYNSFMCRAQELGIIVQQHTPHKPTKTIQNNAIPSKSMCAELQQYAQKCITAAQKIEELDNKSSVASEYYSAAQLIQAAARSNNPQREIQKLQDSPNKIIQHIVDTLNTFQEIETPSEHIAGISPSLPTDI